MTDLDFERDQPNAYQWTDKAFDLLIAGKLDGRVDRRAGLEAATVVGACPRCTHHFRFESSKDAVGTGGRTLESVGSAADPGEYVPVDVQCRCEGAHPGRQYYVNV
jgi:hypothetical protein